MTIRTTLQLLIGLLACALMIAIGAQVVAQVEGRREAERLAAYNAVRASLLGLGARLGEERGRAYVMLNGAASPAFAAVLPQARAAVDALLTSANAELGRQALLIARPEATRATLAAVSATLAILREEVDERLSAAPPGAGRAFSRRWFDTMTDAIAAIQSARFSLLQEARVQQSGLATEARLRYELGLLIESMGRVRARLAVEGLGGAAPDARALDAVRQDLGSAALLVQLTDERQLAGLHPQVAVAVADARFGFQADFLPHASAAIADRNSGPRTQPQAEAWFADATAAIARVEAAQQVLLRSSAAGLAELEEVSRREIASWLALLFAGLTASVGVLLVARRRVAAPIAELSAAMLRLADDDLTVRLPRATRRDEIGAMQNAFRKFKANALQRRRLQRDRQALHERLATAYEQLTRDLKAAAAIQEALLPPPGRRGSLQHVGLFRPSSVVAGDSYNVLERPNGAVAFFQIDVAGHGAPAALVTVASQNALSQAALGRRGDAPLSQLAAEINRDWPEGLPYFTMVFGELDPASGKGRLVQAGHPTPLIVARDGVPRTVGDGGLPVGLLRDADYDEATFTLAKGERLILYSDGLTEAEDPDGEPFGERLPALIGRHANADPDRFLEAIDEEIRRWRASDDLDDDLTVLVIERLDDDDDKEAA